MSRFNVPPAAPPSARPIARARRRGLPLLAVVAALALHWLFVEGLDVTGWRLPASAPPASIATRTIAAPTMEVTSRTVGADEPATAAPPVEATRPPAPVVRTTQRVVERSVAPPSDPEARKPPADPDPAPAWHDAAASAPPPSRDTVASAGDPASGGAAAPVEPGVDTAAIDPSAQASAALPPILGPGDAPPPTYRTVLPAPALWRYEVRRGFFRGTGDIRWQPAADGSAYQLSLEARIAGIAVLRQTSRGTLGANGLEPERLVDQRARRPMIAATFDRAASRVTFSASTRTLPLYPGTQDRLSWLVQLAAIAEAEPGRLAPGGRIDFVVIGARGDASVWMLRSVGVETVDTASGPVRALRLSRAPRGAWDSSADVWLDPERGHAPVHATLRNAQGAVEYDLLLERIEPLP